MPVKVQNPRKNFQFTIILPGLNPFLAQEVKLPDNEFDTNEHGDTNFVVKTAGQRKIGNMTVSKINPAVGLDQFIELWANLIQNTKTGGGALPSVYKRECIVQEYSSDGVTVVQRHVFSGVWPCKINGKEFSRKGSDNTVHSIEFCVDEIA